MIVKQDVVEEDLVPPTESERYRGSPVSGRRRRRLTGRGIYTGQQYRGGSRERAMFRT